ncbi:MAG: hotdog fold thioesterase [Methanoregula sp.]|jgi:acyl-CoA thioesterase|uniref:hotdog fold thioesterase n=1 Tax=Methanoregula sp. TaxID=2052170 RepID=UPI003C2A4344
MTGARNTPEKQPPVSVPGQVTAFEESEFGRLLDMHITDAGDGYARVEMDCSGKLNPHGIAHGGAVFSLADHAFGIASNCGRDHYTAVSVHIQYIAPARGRLAAVAERIASNGTCETYRVVVYEGDRTVALFDGIAFRVSA